MLYAKWKSQNPEAEQYMITFIYMTFWKRQNFRDTGQSSGFQVQGRRKGLNVREEHKRTLGHGLTAPYSDYGQSSQNYTNKTKFLYVH